MTTNYAKASYQEIIDLHTESDTVSVIGIHTPSDGTPIKMMPGFFDQFKKFRYDGCSLILVPAARLPADPLQVSYEAGEPTIDPRDMLNPIMFHGCHGNDMGEILNRLYNGGSKSSNSIEMYDGDTGLVFGDDVNLTGGQLEELYYKALTDNTWRKAHPQKGFRKSGLHPMIYQLATTHQLTQLSIGGSPLQVLGGSGIPEQPDIDTTGLTAVTADPYFTVEQTVNPRLSIMTPRLQQLGWLDTREPWTTSTGNAQPHYTDADNAVDAITNVLDLISGDSVTYAKLPEIFMGMILMPPAYKTEQYYRMVITHHFEFRQFRGISFMPEVLETPAYHNFNDADEDDEEEESGTETDLSQITTATSMEIYSTATFRGTTGNATATYNLFGAPYPRTNDVVTVGADVLMSLNGTTSPLLDIAQGSTIELYDSLGTKLRTLYLEVLGARSGSPGTLFFGGYMTEPTSTDYYQIGCMRFNGDFQGIGGWMTHDPSSDRFSTYSAYNTYGTYYAVFHLKDTVNHTLDFKLEVGTDVDVTIHNT